MLENKLELTSSAELAREEERISKKKALELFEKGILDSLPAGRFSTLQDLDAKRPTEIDMFSGTLVRMGKELHVDTPFNEFAYHAIKCLEEKNSGKIR